MIPVVKNVKNICDFRPYLPNFFQKYEFNTKKTFSTLDKLGFRVKLTHKINFEP